MNTRRRTVLVLGSTGRGKSTLCNVLAGVESSLFEEGDGSVSVTRDHQVALLNIDNEMEIKLVDTVGLGDTSLTEEQVLFKLAHACYEVREGLNKVYFVTNGRFTRAELQVYDLMRTVIFNSDITRFVTIIRTNSDRFMDHAACMQDIENLRNLTPENAEILRSCNNSLLHVNNFSRNSGHPRWQEFRQITRQKLLVQLDQCNEVYRPPEIEQITERIRVHMEEANALQRQNEEMKQMIESQKKDIEAAKDMLVESEKKFSAQLNTFMQTQLQLAQNHGVEMEESRRHQRDMQEQFAREQAEVRAQIERANRQMEEARQRELELARKLEQERTQAAQQMQRALEAQVAARVNVGGGGGGGGGGGRPGGGGFMGFVFRAVASVVPRCVVM